VSLGEPPRTQADLNFPLFGIPVRVHPLFWLMAVILGAGSNRDARGLVVWVGVVFVSILVHELGHAVAMLHYGMYPWITLHGFGGLTSSNPSYRSGSHSSSTGAQVLISLAGPLAGFLLAGLVVGVLYLLHHEVVLLRGGPLGVWFGFEGFPSLELSEFFYDLLMVNIFWGILNLMPIYPLDGGQIARELLAAFNPRLGILQALVLSTFTAVALALIAIIYWKSLWTGLFFGYLAYTNYAILRAYQGRRPQ
jgi:Zn-dependent protease